MSEEVDCESCGESFHPQGIAAHERHCDVEDDEVGDERQLEPYEEVAHDRDNGCCVQCETTMGLVFHQIDPDIDEIPRNTVTLCADCESKIKGLHPRTKRTNLHDY